MKYLLPLVFLPLGFENPAVAQGVSAPWDVSPTIQALADQAGRIRPVLAQLTPEQWQSKGAPSAYVTQWRNAQNELGYLINAANALQKQPDKLTLALEAYFRLQSLESQINSLAEGVRKYQNPAVGDLLVSVVAENSQNRDRLRQYITDLAQTREQEFDIVDKEAQRCRGALTRQAPARPASTPSNAPQKQ